MLNVKFTDVQKNISATAPNKKEAYEKLKAFKDKNEKLKATYVAKGQEKAQIVI
ncbi:MAG: hypothetical protein VB958_10100 [Thalassolituus sp.]|uniref:hypothetical protein n=1 Tax=Thalassolituus sp. TaxID=2030822 RepID=UPI0039820E00